MARVIIKIEGENQTVANINMFDMKRKAEAMAVVRKTALAVGRQARKRVPVSPSNRKKSAGSPGDLKKSIRSKFFYEGLGAMVMPAKPKGSHRHLVEYGTQERRTSKGANRGKAPAQPFMIPARSSQESYYNAEMARIFGTNTTV